jgi:branched-chain amino acid transport system substrate-binding protein
MRARAAVALMIGAALTLGNCGGSSEEPFRVGILSDCYGILSSFHPANVASAELPLIERGGKLSGRSPTDGIEGASAAGRPVELLVGCVTGTPDVIPEARRLVEELGAHVLVGPPSPGQGLVLRDYARRRPETAFVAQPTGAPELTLANSAPNVFRFTSDNAQSEAGLGSYAYNELGWRTAATVALDAPFGWGGVAGFVAEFCALGGRIVNRQWTTPGTDPADSVPRLPDSVDGVYLGPQISSMEGFVNRYASLHPDFSRRLLATNQVLFPGLVTAGNVPLQPTAVMQEHAAAFARAFPGIPAESSLTRLAISYRDGVEAALQALEHAGGAKLTAALARTELDSPAGPVRLDANRQAIAPNYLSRVETDAEGKPAPRTLRVLANVEQTFGGYFKPGDPPPSRATPACRKGDPPPWAR